MQNSIKHTAAVQTTYNVACSKADDCVDEIMCSTAAAVTDCSCSHGKKNRAIVSADQSWLHCHACTHAISDVMYTVYCNLFENFNKKLTKNTIIKLL